MAEPSIRDATARRRVPDDDRLRSAGHALGTESVVDRPEDDSPEADDVPENEPPIERSDGQVYGG